MTSAGFLDSVIDSLINTVDLLELTERLGIAITREGASVKALCLFHADTNPSMVLFNRGVKDKQHFHCFVCNTTADIFKIVQQKNDLKFADAVKWLALSYGIPLPATSSRKKVKDAIAPIAREAGLESASEIYKASNSDDGLKKWLAHRGLEKDVPPDFEVYFARAGTLVGYLKKPKLEVSQRRELLGQLEEVRLVRAVHQRVDTVVDFERNNFLNLGGSYRDYFYDDRIIFPLRDELGRTVGFAGRKVDDHGNDPKYLYSAGLKKSEILFRANNAFTRIKNDKTTVAHSKTLYVCEGLTDVLRLEGLGMAAVGILGSQLSDAQASLLINFARTLGKGTHLNVAVFLDRDNAGNRGANAALRKLLREDETILLNLQFIWPARSTLPEKLHGLKDPDELFRDCTREQALALLIEWTHAPATSMLASELDVLPEHILDDDLWSLLSLSRRYQAVLAVSKLSNGLIGRLLGSLSTPPLPVARWKVDFDGYLAYAALGTGSRSQRNPSAVNDDDARLNLARELAESGTRRGELPTDVAAWRRMDMAATAFNEGIKARLQMRDFRPLEPFDAVFVSRGFGKTEPRLKTMPAPEDLVAQQYLMSELLSERWDGFEDQPFSYFIPAVRYNRRGNTTFTTGERGQSRLDETLSFAYQIDMDVLEGRNPAGESGMFRPYFECWRDFIHTLTRQSRSMPAVHMIRLDVKRYYDRLRKVVVRDALRGPIDLAFEKMNSDDRPAAWFGFPDSTNERPQAIVDWLLDQSFDYKFFHPATGESESCPNEQVGIPQGPILSAWMGSIALFPIDAALRERLETFNSDGIVRAGYARYVDDIVLLADSVEVLGVLRAAAEDAARALQVELVTKETSPVMTAEDFARHLTEGRALATSGPVGEIALLPAGDGDLGWYMLSAEPPKRYAALQLLRDHYLYHASSGRLLDQIGTALRSEDLRPSELGKASRWVWYWAASELSNEDAGAARIFQKYWEGWRKVCAGAVWTLEPAVNHWDDPALYALEGLEKLLESAHWGEETLTAEQNEFRIKIIARIASEARSLDFVKIFNVPGAKDSPVGWGIGARGLQRMFWQRVASMRWKAEQLCPTTLRSANLLVPIQLSSPTSRLAVSLRRALITDAETCRTVPDVIAQKGGSGNSANVLRDLLIWLHDAYVRLGAKEVLVEIGKLALDPLDDICNELDEAAHTLSSHSEVEPRIIFFLNILSKLRQTNRIRPERNTAALQNDEARGYALSTFISICDRDQVVAHLARREHLLPQRIANELCVLLPPLPGVRPTGLISLVCNKPANDGMSEASPNLLGVKWLTVFPKEFDVGSIAANLPSFFLTSASSPPAELPVQWSEPQNGRTATFTERSAPWNQEWPSQFFFAPPNFSPSVKLLSWVADAYEAVAKLNFEVERLAENPDDPVEYVPAWPYFVVSKSADSVLSEPLRIVLAFIPVSKSKITGLAFLRDGSRGLKSYEVAKEGSEFWRLGVAVTDIVGFSSELDKYSALKLPDEETAEHYSPDRYLLRNVLRKLRGHFYRGEFLPRQKDKPHMPATIARSLNLLRAFPVEADLRQGIAYVLACDMETRAMARRIADGPDLNRKGLSAHLLEQTARDVCRRMPLAWGRHLAHELVSGQAHVPSQGSTRAWWLLNERLKSLTGPPDIGWQAFIQGIDLIVVVSWLRVSVFELSASEFGNRILTHTSHGVADAWGIDECAFCNDNNDDSVESLIKRFHIGKIEGRPQSSFDFVTPLGWMVLFAAYSGLLEDPSAQPAPIIWGVQELANARNIAGKLSIAKPLCIDDEGAQSIDWPFEHLVDESIDLVNFSTFMMAAHAKFGFRIHQGIEAAWRFDPKEKTFIDARLETWRFEGWQISISDGTSPEQCDFDGRVFRRWSETFDAHGKLLAVSACGERLSNLLKVEVHSNQEATLTTSVSAVNAGFSAEESKGNVIALIKPEESDQGKQPQRPEEPRRMGELVEQHEPLKAVEARQANETSQAEIPIRPEEPIHPKTPIQPEEARNSEEPTRSGPPTQPEEPIQPEVPNRAEEGSIQPEVPNQPEEPIQPEMPDQSEEPVRPEVLNQPEEPVQPEVPNQPEEPVQPEVPNQPEEPIQPEVPNQPEEPIQPGVPNEPDAHVQPQEPIKPEEPGEPGEPAPLEESTQPEKIPQQCAASIVRAWKEVQGDAWSNRKAGNPGHIRVALLQWRVDDSYRHPIFDLAAPSYSRGLMYRLSPGDSKALQRARDAALKEADHHKWRSCEMLPSWAEYRRRRFLDAAISACARFDVHLLVLPEYSVRPDTVKWLKDRLIDRNLNLNVVAGTYRLFGNKSEPGFERLHREIVGLEDYDNLFGDSIMGRKIGSCLHYGERRAITTLLAPLNNQYGRQIVAVFSRGKKYSSNAAAEIINPLNRTWTPLFSLGGLNSDLERRTPDGKRSESYTPLSAADILGQISATKPLHYFAELICSELFLPISPINYKGLASEYRKLIVRFGGQMSEKTANEDVLRDVMALSDHLGTCSSSELNRRTILLVPAMSGRSADYWTFGQSAVLAGGVTTVFCNAVSPKSGVGGSCFIGRKSWEFGTPVLGIPTSVTPYSGWSRGIFYNTQDDALGEKEQALVIADVDPLYMSEGKPRPQALPVPLQLVAYLPVGEVVRVITSDVGGPARSDDNQVDVKEVQCQICAQLDSAHPTPFLNDHILGHIEKIVKYWKAYGAHNSVMDPTDGVILKNATALGAVLGDSKKPYLNRLRHWSQHWRELPHAGFPPAVLDWILVDLTPEADEQLPEIFVPPWMSTSFGPE
jgi:DNA primase catalytic core